MIRLSSNTRLLAFCSFVLFTGMMVSCNKKDNSPNNGKATLYSFGPTGAKIGDTLRFIGVNLDQVTSIKFSGVNAVVDKSNFKAQASDLIRLIVPQSAEKGNVVLRLSNGDSIVTKTQLNLGITASVSSITKQAHHGDNVTITGNYLNWVTAVTFAKNSVVKNFVSQSINQIVVKVPADAVDGPLLITYAGTDSAQIQTADTLKLIMPQITGMTPNPVDTAANLTITGTDLDQVSSVSFVNVANPVTNFVSQSATQLVVKVPGAALRGKLTFGVKNSTLTVQSPMDLVLNTLPPLADFATGAALYTDATQNGFQDWSYTDTHDFNNTTVVRQGNKSIKAVYGGNGYQGITFHNGGAGISTSGYTKLEFSVYADASSNGKKLQVVTNGAYGGAVPQVTLAGGQWTTFSVNLSSMGNPTAITEIVIQGANFLGTVYIDHVGLR